MEQLNKEEIIDLVSELINIPHKVWYNSPMLPPWAMSIDDVKKRIWERQKAACKRYGIDYAD